MRRRSLQVKEEKKGYEFYKIIRSSSIQNQCIRLPPKVVRKFSSGLSNVAFLKVTDGKKWHVELRTTDGELFFQNGWQEFVEYYSISTGHFLVFKYTGNSIFCVVIFDTTGSEISYPSNLDKTDEPKCGEKITVSDCDAGKNNPSKKTEDIVVMPVAKTHSCAKAPSTRRSSVVAREKDVAIRQSSALELKHPSFTSVIKPSFCCSTLIPLAFVKRYLKDDLRSLTLEVPDGRRWPVGCLIYKGKSAYLSQGWAKFAEENSLNEGDICVFEMIKKNVLLKVQFFRIKNMTPTILRPSFTVVMKPSSQNYLYIPIKFARKYVKCGLRSVTLEVSDGRKWIVWCTKIYGKTSAQLSTGWVKFAKENSLKEGDICLFEMVNYTSLKVHIYRNIKNMNTPPSIFRVRGTSFCRDGDIPSFET